MHKPRLRARLGAMIEDARSGAHAPPASPYAPRVTLSIRLRRRAYRTAYALLRVYWFLLRRGHEGVKCVLTDGGSVLLVRHTYGPAVWELPGGSIKRGEAPVTAAGREVEEELGVSVPEWTPLGRLVGRFDYREDILYCFRAEIGAPALNVDRGEIADTRWFALDQLPPDVGRFSAALLEHALAPSPAVSPPPSSTSS